MKKGRRQLWGVSLLIFSTGSSGSVTEAFAPRDVSRARTKATARQTTFLQVTETEEMTTLETQTITSSPSFPCALPGNSSDYSDLSIIWSSADLEDEGDEPQGNERASPDAEQSTEASAEESSNGDISNEESDASKAERLANAAKAAALLSRRRGGPSRSVAGRSPKSTSVGERRVGSASRARQGTSSTEKLIDAVRKSSSANTNAVDDASPKSSSSPAQESETTSMIHPSNSQVFQQAIHSTVSDMLDQARRRSMTTPVGSMGLFGEPHLTQEDILQEHREPRPGTVLVHPKQEAGSGAKTSNRLSVRVATRSDDYDIANLRLSVFSDFSAEMRRNFCAKSAHILDNRRRKGATCIVSTVPRYGSILSSRTDVILGSAECSDHEFLGTELGQRRPTGSLLYVTEVAVSPAARRKGVGFKMMEAVEKLGKIRGAETIYLHVDVTNYAALVMYEKAGFDKVTSLDPMYYEFTKSLNLHDGATKGRKHFLLQKHLKAPTWLPYKIPVAHEHVSTGALGFEVPVET